MARHKPDYQQPPPKSMREEIWSAKRITALQLLRIGAWKSAQGLAWLTLNTEEDIDAVSRRTLTALERFRTVDVMREPVDWDTWEQDIRDVVGSKQDGTGLLALSGVRYPMASAVLSFLAPAAFPIIDRWTVTAVFGSPSGRWGRAAAYTAFTRQLVALQPVHYPACRTIHDVDQAVMEAAMRCHQAGCKAPCPHIPYQPLRLPA